MAKEIEKVDVVLLRLDNIENRVELLEVIAKKQLTEVPEETQKQEMKKVIQINTKPKLSKPLHDNKGNLTKGVEVIEHGKKYYCTTPQEQKIFTENNPDVETESFNIELSVADANKYLNDPENKKEFTRKVEEKVNV